MANRSPKTRCSGEWTEARYKSFIISALRSKSSRWKPKQQCISEARVERGIYKCDLCGAIGGATLPPLKGKDKRRKNIIADHITPVIDPTVGFVDWNTFIDRLFCERDGFQAVCWECHTSKTKEERDIATERKRKEKTLLRAETDEN